MEKGATLGVDLGGTKVEMALVDGSGQIYETHRYPTQAGEGPESIISDLIDAVKTLQNQSELKVGAMGIGAAGQVDAEGTVRTAPNLPFNNEPLQAKLEKELGLPVLVTNDVSAATYGEWRFGSGKGINDLVVIFVGTGIGGGVISGGKLLTGCNNTLGELGHITLIANGRRCRCPNIGCIEAYAGGWAIAERAIDMVSANPDDGARLKSLAGSSEKITAATVSQGYHEGDPMSKKIVEETGQYLGSGVVGIVNAFNPCQVVLGGGVIEGLPELIPMVEEVTRKHALKPNLNNLKIVKAALGGKAGVIGAAALARNSLGGDLWPLQR